MAGGDTGANGEVQSASAGDAGDAGSIPAREGPLERGMAALSRAAAWGIAGTEEPGRPWSTGSMSGTRLKRLSTRVDQSSSASQTSPDPTALCPGEVTKRARTEPPEGLSSKAF